MTGGWGVGTTHLLLGGVARCYLHLGESLGGQAGRGGPHLPLPRRRRRRLATPHPHSQPTLRGTHRGDTFGHGGFGPRVLVVVLGVVMVVVVMVVVGGPLTLLVHVQHVLLGDAGVQRQFTGVHLQTKGRATHNTQKKEKN